MDPGAGIDGSTTYPAGGRRFRRVFFVSRSTPQEHHSGEGSAAASLARGSVGRFESQQKEISDRTLALALGQAVRGSAFDERAMPDSDPAVHAGSER